MLKYGSGSAGSGAIVQATPDTAPLHYVGAVVHQMLPGMSLDLHTDGFHECALILLSGQIQVECDGIPSQTLSGRASVFDDRSPDVVYVPSYANVRVYADSQCEVVWASALLDEPSHLAAKIYVSSDMRTEARGEGVTARQVRHLLEDPGQAIRLRLVEVLTPGGHWSSFPPHKHDRESPPQESKLEELYYYHVSPAGLWAFQRVYDDTGWGEAMAVEDRDLVIVPRGYHPVAAPPGVNVYYLNVMAGPKRDWYFTTDPKFGHVPGFQMPNTGGDS
jgi:5-deoxy-glucuronate isomerase